MHVSFVTFMVCQCVISVSSLGIRASGQGWPMHNDKVIAPELDKIDVIKELLLVKFAHPIPYFDITDIDVMVGYLCMELFFLYLVCTFVEFYNKYIGQGVCSHLTR